MAFDNLLQMLGIEDKEENYEHIPIPVTDDIICNICINIISDSYCNDIKNSLFEGFHENASCLILNTFYSSTLNLKNGDVVSSRLVCDGTEEATMTYLPIVIAKSLETSTCETVQMKCRLKNYEVSLKRINLSDLKFSVTFFENQWFNLKNKSKLFDFNNAENLFLEVSLINKIFISMNQQISSNLEAIT